MKIEGLLWICVHKIFGRSVQQAFQFSIDGKKIWVGRVGLGLALGIRKTKYPNGWGLGRKLKH